MDKPFRVVGGNDGAPPPPDNRSEEEKLRDFFDQIIQARPRCVTCLLEVDTDKGSYHEMRTHPDIDVAEIGNIYLAYRAIQAIVGNVTNN